MAQGAGEIWNEFVGKLIIAAGMVVAWCLILVGLVIYFLPTVFAVRTRKRNRIAIGALNTLLGWSLIGWVIALLWAITPDRNEASG